MSLNGRRAWRKWATRRRRLFRRLCRDLRSGAHTKVTPTPYDTPIKQRVRKSSEGRGPRATPPKPFTSRSLVGMTMGARKRKAWTRYQSARFLCDDAHDDWTAWRSTYRIGQHLRPCVGCLRCKCRSAFDAWPELGEELAKDHPTCDGSGVLPARKDKT